MRHILYMYRFNSIVRKKYLEALEDIPWEEVVKDRGASFGSIRDVFVHVLDAYRYWFHYVIGGNDILEYKDIDLDTIKSVYEMRSHEREVDGMVMEFIDKMTEEELSDVCTIQSDDPDDDEVRSMTLESILIHMIEEELQHRGELNCMLWQMDVDPPIGSGEDLIKAME